MNLSVKISNFVYYFIFWSLLFLLGNYIGSYYRFLYIFLTLVLIINLIHYIISINNIYYYQLFSNEHPKKGENIEYKLTIENRIPFLPSFFKIEYEDTLKLEDQIPKIMFSRTNHIYSEFSLPYRGIYNVGMKAIICRDILNIFNFKLTFWPRTFYVYPRINKNILIKEHGSGELTSVTNKNSDNNSDFLDTIEKYRPGSKLSHISWKHYASTGEPFIRKYYSEEGSKNYIFLDKTELPNCRKGPADDLAIETLISILQRFNDMGELSIINNWPENIDNSTFQRYYKDTINIKFDKSEYDTLLDYKTQKYSSQNRLNIVTTFESSFFLDMELIQKQPNLTIYVITKGLSKDKKMILSRGINKFSKYVDIICIN